MPAVPAESSTSSPHLGADLARRVADEQTALLYQRSHTATMTGVPFALLVCWGLIPYDTPMQLWTWFAMRCTVSGVRLLLRQRFFAQADRAGQPWRGRLLVVLAVDGFVWSLAVAWLSPPHHPDIVALMVAALVGVSAVALFVLQAASSACACFLVPLLLPVVVSQALQDSRAGVFTAIGVLLFLGLMLWEARRAALRIRELLRLRFTTDRIAEERAEALALAQRQSSVKSQFLATMSHEMRTPLHGILGLARLLRRQPEAPSAAQWDVIERAGEHLLAQINDILDFSHLQGGTIALAQQRFDLAQLIDDVVAQSSPAAGERGLLLQTRLSITRPALVEGDAARLRQVLQQLLGNAIKFTEAGSVTLIVKHHPVRGRVRIDVRDTGIGIAAADRGRIFDAFQQGDNSYRRRYGGTGLGLTIARELARAMGGDLVCTSVPGEGSNFRLTLALPTAAPDAPAIVQTGEPAGPNGERSARLLSGHVLLAEDNPVNALVAEAALQGLGLSVQVVGDGEQAVAAFKARRPDLVLMDCQMPLMDGFEAARRMREHEQEAGDGRRTPIVALTANAMDGDRERSLAAGMDDHMAKPFRDDALWATLRRLLVQGRD